MKNFLKVKLTLKIGSHQIQCNPAAQNWWNTENSAKRILN